MKARDSRMTARSSRFIVVVAHEVDDLRWPRRFAAVHHWNFVEPDAVSAALRGAGYLEAMFDTTGESSADQISGSVRRDFVQQMEREGRSGVLIGIDWVHAVTKDTLGAILVELGASATAFRRARLDAIIQTHLSRGGLNRGLVTWIDPRLSEEDKVAAAEAALEIVRVGEK